MKLKSLYLVLLMLCMSTAMFAQEKYEQAVVMQANIGTGYFVFTSIEGKEYEKEKIMTKDGLTDLSLLLKKIADMRNQGWEVWSAATSPAVTYFLRRKIK